jgi:hypothetical protein
MVFTLEQNKFIIMSYYRNGIKRDGEWTYSPLQLTLIKLLIVLLLLVVLKGEIVRSSQGDGRCS